MKIALFGLGYWGKKIYSTLKNKNIDVYVVEKKTSDEGVDYISKKDFLLDNSIQNCFIVTPEETHFSLAKECLNYKKNVFVEKPLSLKASQAKELLSISRKNECFLTVDQVFLYDPSFIFLKKIINKDTLQKITKISSKRWSVLSCDKKIHVIQDLMPHDLYIYDALKALDCSILNKNDINKKVFKKERAVFSFKKNNVEFKFDYDWYADSVEREMSFYMDDGEKIIWKKDQGYDKILFYKNGILKKTKVIEFKNPSPLELLVDDFLNKKLILSLKKSIEHISFMSLFLD